MMSQRPAMPCLVQRRQRGRMAIRFAVVGDELERTALPMGPAERLANPSTIVERVLGVPVENLPTFPREPRPPSVQAVDLHQGYAQPIDQSSDLGLNSDKVKAMPQMCQQIWPRSAVPPEYLWLMPIIMPFLAIVLLGVPVASILHRASRSRWWTLVAFIPVINLIGLWIFAFSRWPVVDRPSMT
jgi:hypothetical protein